MQICTIGRCPSDVSKRGIETSTNFSIPPSNISSRFHPTAIYPDPNLTKSTSHFEILCTEKPCVWPRKDFSMEDGKSKVVFRGVSKDEEGRKKVEKTEVSTHNPDTLKHFEKKLIDKGVRKLERHPVDGLPLNRQPKSGHGGKFTWEGPRDLVDNEFLDVPLVVDKGDPNYIDDDDEDEDVKGEQEEVAGLVVGEVEVAKEANKGVARIEVNL